MHCFFNTLWQKEEEKHSGMQKKCMPCMDYPWLDVNKSFVEQYMNMMMRFHVFPLSEDMLRKRGITSCQECIHFSFAYLLLKRPSKKVTWSAMSVTSTCSSKV